MAKASLTLFAMIVTALMLSQPASAATLTSVITDPEGDAFVFGHPGEPFLDVVRAEVSLKHGTFEFVMQLAGAIPESPELPEDVILFDWRWSINTDPTAYPKGFPFAPGHPAPGEFVVQIIWDGTAFAAWVVDRRFGVVTVIPFTRDGSEFSVTVDAGLLDNPPSFDWAVLIDAWTSGLGTHGVHQVDFAGPGSWSS